MADEEDVALSAFDSFCRAAEQGRLEQLLDRDSLWSHLFLYTIRKAHYLTKRERAQKRGHGKVQHEGAMAGPDGEVGMLEILAREPTPEMAVLFEEQCRLLLDRLPSAELRSVMRTFVVYGIRVEHEASRSPAVTRKSAGVNGDRSYCIRSLDGNELEVEGAAVQTPLTG